MDIEDPLCQAGLSCSKDGPRYADHLKQLIVPVIQPHDLSIPNGIVFIGFQMGRVANVVEIAEQRAPGM